MKGNNISVGSIDTARVVIPLNLWYINWKLHTYEADGHYIKECIDDNIDKRVYIDEDLCYDSKLA